MRIASRRVGVRELRQNLSVHLKRVAAGETLEVTERGKPVAELGPLRAPRSPLARLVESGRATAPAGGLVELGPPRGSASSRLSRALDVVRAERL